VEGGSTADLQTSPGSHSSSSPGQQRPASPGALAAAQRALVTTVVPELGLLRLFVVLNYTAVVKVCPLLAHSTCTAHLC